MTLDLKIFVSCNLCVFRFIMNFDRLILDKISFIDKYVYTYKESDRIDIQLKTRTTKLNKGKHKHLTIMYILYI